MENPKDPYKLARKILRQAVEKYDPFAKVQVKGPFEGNIVFPDGSSYHFKNGLAMVHRKNLNEAYNLGCKRTTRRRRQS